MKCLIQGCDNSGTSALGSNPYTNTCPVQIDPFLQIVVAIKLIECWNL